MAGRQAAHTARNAGFSLGAKAPPTLCGSIPFGSVFPPCQFSLPVPAAFPRHIKGIPTTEEFLPSSVCRCKAVEKRQQWGWKLLGAASIHGTPAMPKRIAAMPSQAKWDTSRFVRGGQAARRGLREWKACAGHWAEKQVPGLWQEKRGRTPQSWSVRPKSAPATRPAATQTAWCR